MDTNDRTEDKGGRGLDPIRGILHTSYRWRSFVDIHDV
jgi:hypothetical protein